MGGSVTVGDDTIDIPSVYSLTHNVTAQGEPFSGLDPTHLAQQFVGTKLGFSNIMSGVSGILNSSGVVCNNFRTVSVNKTDGTCNASETFVINPSGRYREDFEISTNTSLEDAYTTIDINGTIQGYANISYPDPNVPVEGSTPKFQNAMTAWDSISGITYSRANSFYKINPKHLAFLASNSLNPTTLSTAFGYNITEGTITYAYSYNDRPINCVADALTETININETEPNDIFASLTVLGRKSGPLLQDIGTSGARTRDISIDAFLPIRTGCNVAVDFASPTEYANLVNEYEANLVSSYGSVYINSHTTSWQPKIGRFTFNKSWTVGDC